MHRDPACAACGNETWEVLCKRALSSIDMHAAITDRTAAARLIALLDAAGQTSHDVEFRVCKRCGFVCFMPRPDETEATQLAEPLQSSDEPNLQPSVSGAIDGLHALCLADELEDHLVHRSRVLSIGGGDGRHLTSIANRGNVVFIVDSTPSALPGVVRLGAGLDALDSTARFDAICLDSTLEHSAEPAKLLSRARAHLNDDGVLLVEVPMDLFGRQPPRTPPLTSINCFQTTSLSTLLERVGLRPLNCVFAWHYTQPRLVVRALCEKSTPSERRTPDAAGARLTRALLRRDPRPLRGLMRGDAKRTGAALLGYSLRAIRRLRLGSSPTTR